MHTAQLRPHSLPNSMTASKRVSLHSTALQQPPPKGKLKTWLELLAHYHTGNLIHTYIQLAPSNFFFRLTKQMELINKDNTYMHHPAVVNQKDVTALTSKIRSKHTGPQIFLGAGSIVSKRIQLNGIELPKSKIHVISHLQ